MTWKSWIPYHGDHTVRQKLNEIDNAGVGIPILIVMFIQKGIELFLQSIGQDLPIPLWLTFTLAGILIFVTYVYDKQLKQKAQKAKEEVEDKVEE